MQYLKRIENHRFVCSSRADAIWGFRWAMTTKDVDAGISKDSADYIENLAIRSASLLGAKDFKIAIGRQVHGDHVEFISSSRARLINEPVLRIPDTDGLCTDSCNLVLGIASADCAAVAVFVPNTPFFGVAHSGWRSTALNISARLINLLENTSGRLAKDMQAVISPCISAKNYEVGQEVVETLSLDPDLKDILPKQSSNGKYYLSIPRVIAKQLECAGMSRDNIELPELCTFGREELFYSWRRSKDSGRMLTLAFGGIK